MARTIELFLKNQHGLWGPLSVGSLRERLSATGYTDDTLVSLDGSKWFSARKIEGIVRQRQQAPAPIQTETPDVSASESRPAPASLRREDPSAPDVGDNGDTSAATPESVVVSHVPPPGSEELPTPKNECNPPAGGMHGATPPQTPPEEPDHDIAPEQDERHALSSNPNGRTAPSSTPSQDGAPPSVTQPSVVQPVAKSPVPGTADNGLSGTSAKRGQPTTTRNSPQPNESRERLRNLLTQVQRASRRLPWIFPWSVGGVFFASSAVLLGIACGLFYLLPFSLSMDVFVLAALLPCVLGGSAVSHLAGNQILRLLTGLNDKERRCLALHLPWRSTPAEWPRYLRKWIYTGDWLVENFGGDLLPYVRAFITGAVPCDLEEELDLWAQLMSETRSGKGGQDFEVGHSVREMACVPRLPSWARDVMPGMTLRDLELQLGKAGRAWAMSLIRRASRRKNIFKHVDLGGDLHEVSFEFHYCEMGGGREGLLVIIRPRLDDKSLSFLDDSRSDELAAA